VNRPAKTALITGSNRGLGLALAQEFAFAGHRLILHCRKGYGAFKGPSGLVVEGDLREQATIDRLALAASEFDLDVLVNNAGVYLDRPLLDIAPEEVREIVEVNLLAPMFLTMAVWPVFARKGSGLVININSLASRAGRAGESVYAASKAGLKGFSQTLKREATRLGIQVMDVCLGAMRTPMMERRPHFDEMIDPSEVAGIIVRFCDGYKTMDVTNIDICRKVH